MIKNNNNKQKKRKERNTNKNLTSVRNILKKVTNERNLEEQKIKKPRFISFKKKEKLTNKNRNS